MVVPSYALNPPHLHGLRVLVVEDDDDARELLAEILVQEGADVETAPDARVGLEAMLRFKPTVLVSDIGMPGEDGYAFLRRCRHLPADAVAATPAIALTAFCRPEDKEKSRAAGFDVHLCKPVNVTSLVATIVDLARKGRAEST
jgi:CheY-like chemotaxis protein